MTEAQYGFFVDTTRCIKCYACEVACQQWHSMKAGTFMRRTVHEACSGTFPNVKRTFTSLSCMHCARPACVSVCPVGALSKRAEDGLVVADKTLCIGCRSCALACPFDVPRYGDRKIMDKCDGCLSLGRKAVDPPRCANTCPTRALRFGRLDDMAALSEKKGGARMDGDTEPSVCIAKRAVPADENGDG